METVALLLVQLKLYQIAMGMVWEHVKSSVEMEMLILDLFSLHFRFNQHTLKNAMKVLEDLML